MERRVEMLGAIWQELLSGIALDEQFEKLKIYLRAFPDMRLDNEDYEVAASFFNRCRAKGIQGSNTDFLICAAASRRDMSIYTTDKDFQLFAKELPIRLFVESQV
jgi:predicted nucleic acid-binding protein